MSNLKLEFTRDIPRSSYEENAHSEIEEFNSFAVKVLGEALARPERAIIKTYIAWKLGLHEDSASSK